MTPESQGQRENSQGRAERIPTRLIAGFFVPERMQPYQYINTETLSALSGKTTPEIRKHRQQRILPCTRKVDKYYYHPEDVRDYVYLTCGRLERLLDIQCPHCKTIFNSRMNKVN